MIDYSSRLSTQNVIEASAPCRVDMGGTLDIRTFYLPLRRYRPCTVNFAINLRTTVKLSPYHSGKIRIEADGFNPATFSVNSLPFDHPLGLVCALVAYWGVSGIRIRIQSPSPPRSALGGSSAAAVALTAALSRLTGYPNGKPFSRNEIVRLAHLVEESIAGVPCGLQDQLAAAYGGVHLWTWQDGIRSSAFQRLPLIPRKNLSRFSGNLLFAYCGIPHESKNINGIWVRQFLQGMFRKEWGEIAGLTRDFGSSVSVNDLPSAVESMNRETELRRKMAPAVLDQTGEALIQTAREVNCGARFTGAGGGGCIWAIGEPVHIMTLKHRWEALLAEIPDACLLPASIDTEGLKCTDDR